VHESNSPEEGSDVRANADAGETAAARHNGSDRTARDRRQLWFTSPVVLGVVTGIAGLLGTGIGASLQGYWSTRLERQKFEAALIQDALSNPDRVEVAKHLLFLVEAGVIQGLNGTRIARLARDPENLPTLRSVVLAGETIEYMVDEAGRISFVDGWSETAIISVTIPQLIGVPGAPGNGVVRFYRGAAADLQRAFQEIEQSGLLSLVKSWDGSYSPRAMTGRSRISAHGLGIAFDINVPWNPAGREPPPASQEGSVIELVPIFQKHGFQWGGDFRGYPDPNHFQWSRGATPR
jgi:hypothetical protein